MVFKKIIERLFNNAKGIRDDVAFKRKSDGGGIHPFASRRERAISDISRARLLLAASQAESGGNTDCGPRNTLRNLIPSLGEQISKRTGESEVYWHAADDAYYKVKSPSAKALLKQTSESDWIYEHIIHNILFPETAYELIAIGHDHGEIRLVLKQVNVSSERVPTDAEVAGYLTNKLGLVPEDRYWFGNEVLAVTDVGERGDNVLKGDDDLLYFIDPLIRLKRPALDVIEWLVGTLILDSGSTSAS